MRIGDGRYKHPGCDNCISDLNHIFWECPKFHQTRQKHMALLDDYVETLRRKAPARARELDDMMCKPCFKNCGICIAENEARDITDKLPQKDPLFDAISDNDLNWAERLATDSEGYVLAYPDGSAINTRSRHTARAGWAVFYGHGSRYNAADALRGPIKNSFRAEVRAIAHVVSTCTVPTHIKSDCKSAVTLFDRLSKNPDEEIGEWAESDLWEIIRSRLPQSDNNFVKCSWIPSHLGEAGKENQLRDAIDRGIITAEDVAGNDAADGMAKEMLKRE